MTRAISHSRGYYGEKLLVDLLKKAGLNATRTGKHGTADRGDIHVDGNVIQVKSGEQAESVTRAKLKEWRAAARRQALATEAALGEERTPWIVVIPFRTGESNYDHRMWGQCVDCIGPGVRVYGETLIEQIKRHGRHGKGEAQ